MLVEINGQKFHRVGDEVFPDYLNHGFAAAHIFHVAEKFCRGHGADIGCGRREWAFPGSAIHVDRNFGHDARDLSSLIPDGSLDYLFSSHLLEHLDQPREAIKHWATKLKSGPPCPNCAGDHCSRCKGTRRQLGGTMFLYLPHPACTPWQPGGAWVGSGHKWVPEVESLIAMFYDADLRPVKFAREHDAYWSWYIVGRKQQ
jgi:hypothetical protein